MPYYNVPCGRYKVFQLTGLSKCLLPAVNNKIKVPPGAEELVGRAVEHLFEKEDGEKNEWRGMVLSRAPIMTHWYYITYEKDPVLYMYQLWDDYKDGDLRVLPESGTATRAFVFVCIKLSVFQISDAPGKGGRKRAGQIYIVSVGEKKKKKSWISVLPFFILEDFVQSFGSIQL